MSKLEAEASLVGSEAWKVEAEAGKPLIFICWTLMLMRRPLILIV